MTTTLKELNEQLQEDDGLKVIDFWASWCGPCRQYTPVIEKAAEEFNDVKFIDVNLDESAELVSEYQITSVPTTIFIKNGEIKERVIGAKSFNDLSKIVEFHKSN